MPPQIHLLVLIFICCSVNICRSASVAYKHHMKLKKVFGSSFLTDVFSSESSLRESNMLSFVKLEESWSKGTPHPFLGCSTYRSQFAYVKSSLAERNIPFSIVHSSAADDTICFQALVHPDLAASCQELVDNIEIFLPVPHLLKLEGGLSTKISKFLGNSDISVFDTDQSLKSDQDSSMASSYSEIKLLFESLIASGVSNIELSIALDTSLNISESKSRKMVDDFSFPQSKSSLKIHEHFNKAIDLSSKYKSRMSNKVSSSDHDDLAPKYQKYSQLFRDRAHYPFQDRMSRPESIEEKKNLFGDRSFHKSKEGKSDLWGIFRDTFVLESFKSFPLQSCVFFDNSNSSSLSVASKKIKYRKSNIIIPIDISKVITSSETDRTCIISLIEYFMSMPEVSKVGFSPPIRLQNNAAKAVIQSGNNGTPFHSAGVLGTNVIVGLSDTGIDEDSCYFIDTVKGKVPRTNEVNPTFDNSYRKVVEYVAYGSGGDYSGGHGSHVAGSIAGECNDSKNANGVSYNGMAPKAKLAIFDIGVDNAAHELVVPADLSIIYDTAYVAGAKIHSNSWGGGYWYDSYAIETDDYLYSHDDFAIFFAGGNDGGYGYQSVLSPGTAKNAIAVTSTENAHGSMNINHISSYSSYGPANDGRLKPDIAAPGNSITSVKSQSEDAKKNSCETRASSGTSMATPVMAGNAALVVDYFQNPNFWKKFCKTGVGGYPFCKSFSPRGSMLKAVLLNSGDQCNLATQINLELTTMPDIYQGYGRANLQSTLPLKTHATATRNLFIDEITLTDMTETVYSVTVTKSDTPLKVTISWYDPVASAFAARTLVNDIDLIVYDSSKKAYYGNAGATVGKGSVLMPNERDEVNSNEQVFISKPKVGTGTYQIHVQAKRILGQTPSQVVSVVVTHDGDVTVVNNVWHKLTPISANDIRQCTSTTGSGPKTQLEIAKFALDQGEGWFSSDFYSLKDSKGTSIVSSGSFNYPYYFANDEVCLPIDQEFTLSLSISQVGTHSGTQVGIPQCQVLLSPLSPTQKFTLDSKFMSNYSNNYFVDVDDYSCKSSCRSSPHFIMGTQLIEWSGSGWAGAYYSLQSLHGSLEDTLASRALNSGALEWGFWQYDPVCLPEHTSLDEGSDSNCYYMELSIPKESSAYPEMFFDNATLISVYNDATKTFDYPATPTPCSNHIRYNESLAKVCVKKETMTAEISFFAQKIDLTGFGQKYTTWSEVLNIFRNSSASYSIATCSVPLIYVSMSISDAPSISPTIGPTIAPSPLAINPTLTPSFYPTAGPSLPPTKAPSLSPSTKPSFLPTRNPTASPTSESIGYDVSCLSSCNQNISNKEDACDLLIAEVLLDCNSYSLSEGTCKVSKCASTCSIDTICRLGATLVYDCYSIYGQPPGDESMAYQRLFDNCVSSHKNNSATDGYTAQNKPKRAQVSYVGIIILVIIFIIAAIVVYIWYPQAFTNCFGLRNNTSAYKSVGSSSEHGLVGSQQGSSTHNDQSTERDGIEMPTRKDRESRYPLSEDDNL